VPYTVNGIGTHYYGRGNRSEVVGRCEHCGRGARLSSYDTWECVCVIFIPIIPLRRYRILNECAACRRHQRLDQLRARLRVVRSLRDPLAQGHDLLVKQRAELRQRQALMSLQMWAEADREARAGVGALPDHAELNRLAGEIARYCGDNAGATPFLRKAADLAPRDVRLRTLLGQHLFEAGSTDEAIHELASACATDSSHWPAAYWHAQALLRVSRWGEALAALERVLSLRPDLSSDKAFVADVARCKRALNYPLSAEETRAVRRRWWWPFGGARVGSPASSRTGGWVLLAILGVLVLGALGVGWWHRSHMPVYFDNGLAQPVSIAFGSDSFNVPARGRVERSMAPAKGEVVVTGAGGVIERTPVKIEAPGLFDAIFDSRLCVYNVSARRIYRRTTITYTSESSRTPPVPPQSQLIAFERFFVQDGVDDPFRDPPETISMSSGTQSVTRIALAVADLDYAALTAIRFGEGKTGEAERAARKAIEIEGCTLRVRRNLVLVLLYSGSADPALEEVRRWRSECPDAGVEAERLYQDVMRSAGRWEQLVAEYRERLARKPGDGATHYLLGRLADDPRQGLEEQRQAVRLDPKLTWAHVAMAHDLMALERCAEAAQALSTALGLPHENEIALAYAHAAIGAGRMAEAKERLGALSRQDPQNNALTEARWLVSLAQGDWPVAASLERALASRTDDDGERVARRATLAALRGEAAEVERELSAAVAKPASREAAAFARFARLVESGRYSEAVAALDSAYPRSRSKIPAMIQLHAAAALLLQGDNAQVQGRLQEVERTLGDASADSGAELIRAALGVLRGRLAPAQLVEAARRTQYLTLDDAYYWAGVRAQLDGRREAARQHYASSVRTNYDRGFPYLAARRLAGLPPAGAAARN
jgi:tetratricopeptide (TPR) repeat protein